MKTMHLFAGAGGGLLADLILGHEPVVAVEQDPDCCRVLRARVEDGWFPELHVWEGDIRLFDPSPWKGRVDCIHAGFPCQDISVANPYGRGIKGERSGLVWEVFRTADVVRPKFIFLENSPRIRTKGRDQIIAELVARGYAWRDGVLAASDVGAPHQRKRWWLLAADPDSLRQLQQEGCEQDVWRWTDHGAPEENAIDTMCKRFPNSGGESAATPCFDVGGSASVEPREASATRAPTWFEVEPDVGVLVHGMADALVPVRSAIRALGNGQVPLQAALAWMLLGGPIEWGAW